MLQVLQQVKALAWRGYQGRGIPKFGRSVWPHAAGRSPAVEAGGCLGTQLARECIRLEAARCLGSLVEVGAVVLRTREGEAGRARWGNQEAAEVGLQCREGNQEEVAAEAGCGGVMIWMLPGRVIADAGH
jgi:hypothetical protein